MKYTNCLLLSLLWCLNGFAQTEPHYTMFMYDKLLYNPGYAGNKDMTTVNADYRDQWTGISGAPKTFNVTVDGPVGSYMSSFRPVAIGISADNEQLGVENNTDIKAYYAYRIKLRKSVISFGIDAGAKIYSANYNELNPYQQNDPNLVHSIKNELLPNFGAGVYWAADHFYAGLAIPNLLENYYDKSGHGVSNETSREIRGYYLNGGYVFPVNEMLKLEPQVIVRYSGDGTYQLPVNCDFNVSAILYDRLMVGVTYRTDNSVEGIIHIQATKNLNVGYAYDYLMSALEGYSGGSHEIVVGYDFVRDNSKYTTPRFIKPF
jgi:type IX secretion system PorP/SprF family membrane protein